MDPTKRDDGTSSGLPPPTAPTTTTTKADKPKARRTYRACQWCRGRKLKCDLGDPEAPSEGPCKRCRRESRPCILHYPGSQRASYPPPPPGTVLSGEGEAVGAKKRKLVIDGEGEGGDGNGGRKRKPSASSGTGNGTSSATAGTPTPIVNPAPPPPPPPAPPPPPTQTHQHITSQRTNSDSEAEEEDDELNSGDEESNQSNILISSKLHNPSDALKLLAFASAQRSLVDDNHHHGHGHNHGHSPGFGDLDNGAGGDGGKEEGGAGTGGAGGISPAISGSEEMGVGMGKGKGKGKGSGMGEETRKKSVSTTMGGVGQTTDESWMRWRAVRKGWVEKREAEALFLFFQLEMSPLYPLLPPSFFSPTHLQTLTTTDSLLLLTIISISARHSPLLLPPRGEQIHRKLSDEVRKLLTAMMDGEVKLRNVGTVEALLLMCEWPLLPERKRKGRRGEDDSPGTVGEVESEVEDSGSENEGEGVEGHGEGGKEGESPLVRVSNRYDSITWTYIGLAVRLAQELGLHTHAPSPPPRTSVATYSAAEANAKFKKEKREREKEKDQPGEGDGDEVGTPAWEANRRLRTWLYAYSADRHVSVRLGRDSVVQPYMSSQWWEEVTVFAPGFSKRVAGDDVASGVQFAVSQGITAALMGTIQERLFSNVEVTRAMLRTGQWEAFLRSLDAELATMRRNFKIILSEENLNSTLVKIELDYILLYGNAVTLRALQERLKRRQKAKDAHWKAPSLLNLQEGRWIIDAIAAAQSILQLAVTVLEPKGFLRLCPARIFQRILFSAVFCYKSLAVGVVEHSQATMLDLLEQTISALNRTSIDDDHLSRGFAALLSHMQSICKPKILHTLPINPFNPSAESGTGATPAATSSSSSSLFHSNLLATQQLNLPQQHNLSQPSAGTAPHQHFSQPPIISSTLSALHGGSTLQHLVSGSLSHGLPPGSAAAAASSFLSGLTDRLPSPSTTTNSLPNFSIYGPTSLPSPPLAGLTSQHHHLGRASTPLNSSFPYQQSQQQPSPHSLIPGGNTPRDPWNWDPSSEFIASGKDQDLLFQSLWADNGMIGGDFNIMGTLLGDAAFGSTADAAGSGFLGEF